MDFDDEQRSQGVNQQSVNQPVFAAAAAGLVVAATVGDVAEVGAASGVCEAKHTMAIGGLDASGEWAADGSVSITAWLRNRLGWTNQRAQRTVTLARRLRAAPVTAARWVEGRLTSGQVEVIAAQLTDARQNLWGEQEPTLLPDLVGLGVRDLTRAMQSWSRHADAVLDGDEPPEEKGSELSASRGLDGRLHLTGSVDSDSAAIVEKALALADSGDLEIAKAARQGEALVDICQWFLDNQTTRAGRRHRPHLNLLLHPDQLTGAAPIATDLDGHPLSAAETGRLLCDSVLHRVVRAGSAILDYGRSTNAISAAVATALAVRDQGCRFPGCDRPVTWCDGHHVQPWEHGGTTDLPNLVLLCRRHHRQVHTTGWAATLDSGARLMVTRPDGTTITSHPPPAAGALPLADTG